MVEEDAARGVHAVTLAEIHGDPVSEDLGAPVRRAWVERRGFALRDFLHLAEHFAA